MSRKLLSALVVSVSCIGAAHALDFPARPVTIVVPFPAGGAADFVARTIAPKLSERLKQPVVIDNTAGASGTVGAAKVVAAAPDGHTMLLGSGSEVSIARLTNPKIKYDGQRDLAPVTLVGTQPLLLVGSTSFSARSMDEVLVLARANPGKLNFGTAGVGTPQHLMGELINLEAKVKLFHIP
ncbi:MAG TPA: tripartite tricarboxylate transporter substrate-binding protein, partial [Candidatus Dormibacteraeota bacterium]|nr:tripartite tricarboxylate transporter substrate-binding protein [Candidatus Dormibacteraeota bacterium]